MKKLVRGAARGVGVGWAGLMLALAAPAAGLAKPGENAADAIAEVKAGGDRVRRENRAGAPVSEGYMVWVMPGPTINDSVYEYGQ